MEISTIRDFLKADGFLIVNRMAIRAFGLDSSIVLAELMRWEDYFSRMDKIEDGGWFYVTLDKFEENTTLTPRQLRRILPKMKKMQIIDVKKRGMPARYHYQIQYDNLLQWLQKVSTSGDLLSLHSIKEKEKEMQTLKVSAPSKSNSLRSMEYVDTDEDGREIHRKLAGPRPEGRNKVAIRLHRRFSDIARKNLDTSVVMDGKGYRACLYAMNTGGLTEKQVEDLFEEWFTLGKPDEETISITRALSARQIEAYKIRNNVK